MKKILIYEVDAFTTKPHKGNPAAVVTAAAGLRKEQMQAIAAEMNYSETAFILPPTSRKADLRIRWFTPTTEVKLCGHATVASFFVLAQLKLQGMKKNGTFQFLLETASGLLPIEVTKSSNIISVKFGLPLPIFQKLINVKTVFSKGLGISPYDFDKRLPPVKCGHAYLPVSRLSTLYEMKPDFHALASAAKMLKIRGICVFSTETVERDSTFHSRFFDPLDGIEEDPVTGSANGPLGVYMVEFGVVPRINGVLSMMGEQGDVIGKRGRVSVEVNIMNHEITSVTIEGSAVMIGKRTVSI